MFHRIALTVAATIVACTITAAAEAAPWTSSPGAVLTVSQPWETPTPTSGRAVGEPSVLRVGGLYRMWYSSGWDSCATGYATSKDGVRWTKYAGNPVLGRGVGVAQACRNSVTYRGGVYYMFFSEGIGYPGSSVSLATSTDGAHWVPQGVVLAPAGGWDSAIQNTAVYFDHGMWRMIYDSMTPMNLWEMGSAHAASPTGPWVRDNPYGPMLWFSRGGIAGGPTIVKTRKAWRLFYQASTNLAALPNDLYEARTLNLTDWTLVAKPVLVRPGGTADQVADSSAVCTPTGDLRVYYTLGDNVALTAEIRYVEQHAGCR